MAAPDETDRPRAATSGQFETPSILQTTPRGIGILRILARHGFAGAIRGRGHWPSPLQVRAALEELGVVYLKFGQVLALQRDLLPPAHLSELERLHDQLPPVHFETVRSTVERELGASLAELFAEFETGPLAAATVAQGSPRVCWWRRVGESGRWFGAWRASRD